MTIADPNHALTCLATALAQSPELVTTNLVTRQSGSRSDQVVYCGAAPILIERTTRQLTVEGIQTHATYFEFNLLHYLATNPDIAFTRSQLSQAVWGHEHYDERTVDVHIGKLRRKMGRHHRHLVTIRGHGYRLAPDIIAVIS